MEGGKGFEDFLFWRGQFDGKGVAKFCRVGFRVLRESNYMFDFVTLF